MAKLTAPLLSMDASGSVGGTLTFAKWKGRNYVRQLVTPSNPKTAAQTANRAMMGYLGKIWGIDVPGFAILPSDWQDQADAGKYSPFNAFTSWNMTLWQQFVAPTRKPNQFDAQPIATYTTWTATGGVRQVTLDLQTTWGAGELWGWVIFRELGGAPTVDKSHAIAVVRGQDATPATYVDSPLEPGDWHYKCLAFGFGSNFATLPSGDVNATVT